MIEIKMSGFCEDCNKAKLQVDYTELSSGLETMKYWAIKCIHEEACQRMHDKVREEILYES